LTPEKVSLAMEAVRAAITNGASQTVELNSKGEVGVLLVDVDYDTSAPVVRAGETSRLQNTVGVIFRPYYLHFSLIKIGNNVLPVPRSARPTFYQNVPAPLLKLRPTFGLSYDRAFGTALGANVQSDLLKLLEDPAQPGAVGADRHLDF